MEIGKVASALMPFRGLRFQERLPGGLAAALGPPDDIESSDAARAFVRNRPYSAVRLEVEDDASRLQFRDSRQLLDRWKRDAILATDPEPCYYVYEQEFCDRGVRRLRRGLFGLVPFDAPEVCVLPHEETWEENRQRRLQLLLDLDTGISPLFLIYDGADTTTLLDQIVERAPTASASTDDGIHRLWRVSDPAKIAAIQRSMQDQHFIIADGHHRFAAAQEYHERRQRPDTALVLACCVEAHDPGIVIRPFHRIVTPTKLPDEATLRARLGVAFDITVEPVGSRDGYALADSLPDDLPVAGIILSGGRDFATARLRDWALVDALLPSTIPEPARRLDVTVVTELVVSHALGVDPTDATHVATVTDADETLAAVRNSTAHVGVLIRPIRLDQVLAVARARGTVPPKSTAFFPKIPMGLVLHEYA